ncbi:unnamed protein product [Kuraishia capsulata CBS 1993]|uniref:Mediator of RNA polymerase II transcription subunit 1 n=1 Tax=Kuraishia capsulata CBS 1993 TaxID=1382522 RepID=W6MH10_9ASCO|nr:uncharacterized protein KUCA_T00000885001 [Kuraishia capsulata CBS 1993]CDK24918.1 unnamed protein product [Kuraishia capsulata CBS 1993]
MSGIDTELVLPISEISEILQKRPGLVSIDGIKRLSNLYGFETFADAISGTVPPVERLSLSGKIVLIDIDFQAGVVSSVSISSAVAIAPLGSAQLDFLNPATSPNIEHILLENLRCERLDSFNRNLRTLAQLDRLSEPSPLDLFNFLHKLAYNLDCVAQYQLKVACEVSADKLKDLKDGYAGIGKIEINRDGKVGVFLKYWENTRRIRRWIEARDRSRYNPGQFHIHFKFMEKMELETRAEPNAESASEVAVASEDAPLVDEKFPDVWFENGKWLLTPGHVSRMATLVLELLPCVWVPEGLVAKWGTRCEFIASDNSNDYNGRILDPSPIDRMIGELNSGLYTQYSLNSRRLRISAIVGSRFVKLHKVMLSDVTQLQQIVDDLRSYCVLTNLLNRLLDEVTEYEEQAVPQIRLSDLAEGRVNGPTAAVGSSLVISNDNTGIKLLANGTSVTIRAGRLEGDSYLAVSEDLVLSRVL